MTQPSRKEDMTDVDTLREVLRYCTVSLEIAEKFYDAATVQILDNIVHIIERGEMSADFGAERNNSRIGRRTASHRMERFN